MKPSKLLASLALTAFAATTAHAGPVRADHPLLGTWKLAIPDTSCVETYRMRADGTSLVSSAEELAETEFEVADKPSEKGFYKWVDKLVRDNGKKDCSGQVTEPAKVTTYFISMHPSGDMFIMCQAEDTKACMGPFVRVKGSAI